jgi:hypothetical protein
VVSIFSFCDPGWQEQGGSVAVGEISRSEYRRECMPDESGSYGVGSVPEYPRDLAYAGQRVERIDQVDLGYDGVVADEGPDDPIPEWAPSVELDLPRMLGAPAVRISLRKLAADPDSERADSILVAALSVGAPRPGSPAWHFVRSRELRAALAAAVGARYGHRAAVAAFLEGYLLASGHHAELADVNDVPSAADHRDGLWRILDAKDLAAIEALHPDGADRREHCVAVFRGMPLA